MCVLSFLFRLLGQENNSNVGRFYASRFFKVKFLFKFLNDFIFQQSCTKAHFGGFFLSVLQQRCTEKQIQRDQGTAGALKRLLGVTLVVSNGINTSHYK